MEEENHHRTMADDDNNYSSNSSSSNNNEDSSSSSETSHRSRNRDQTPEEVKVDPTAAAGNEAPEGARLAQQALPTPVGPG